MTRWQIFTAVALRRLPETIPKRDPLYVRVQQVFDAIEASKSRYSKHELRHLEDKRSKESEDTEIIVNETAQDLEDKWMREKELFQFADHNDRLSKSQYLFIQAKFGTDIKDQWLLPQTTFDRKIGDQDLLDTARRALKDSLNIESGYTIISKVPSSSTKFLYPKKVRAVTSYDGAQVFYLKAHLDLLNQSILEGLDETAKKSLRWFTIDEARQSVSKTYLQGFAKGLVHENRVDVDKVIMNATRYVASVKKLTAKAN